MGALIVDFSPLRIGAQWLGDVRRNIPENVPVVQVDSHNIVPCWIGNIFENYNILMLKEVSIFNFSSVRET
jgi:deoxyribodipyrimidine photo-lyase